MTKAERGRKQFNNLKRILERKPKKKLVKTTQPKKKLVRTTQSKKKLVMKTQSNAPPKADWGHLNTVDIGAMETHTDLLQDFCDLTSKTLWTNDLVEFMHMETLLQRLDAHDVPIMQKHLDSMPDDMAQQLRTVHKVNRGIRYKAKTNDKEFSTCYYVRDFKDINLHAYVGLTRSKTKKSADWYAPICDFEYLKIA